MKNKAHPFCQALFLAAVLSFLISSGNAQAAASSARPMKVKPMKVKHCVDKATDGHQHAKKKETSLKGQPLLQNICFSTDFDGDGTNDCFATTNTYDKKKRLISSQSAGGLPTLYTYDKKGNQTGATSQFLVDTNGDGTLDVQQRVAVRTFDKWGNLLTETVDGAPTLMATYDGRNNLLSSRSNVDTDGDGIPDTLQSYTYTNTYDCKGNLTNQVQSTDPDDDGIFDPELQRVYSYDAKGRVLKLVTTFLDLSQPAVCVTYSYDKKGNLISMASITDADGSGTFNAGDPSDLTTNTYDKKGRLSLTQFTADYDGDGVTDPDTSYSIQYVY